MRYSWETLACLREIKFTHPLFHSPRFSWSKNISTSVSRTSSSEEIDIFLSLYYWATLSYLPEQSHHWKVINHFFSSTIVVIRTVFCSLVQFDIYIISSIIWCRRQKCRDEFWNETLLDNYNFLMSEELIYQCRVRRAMTETFRFFFYLNFFV